MDPTHNPGDERDPADRSGEDGVPIEPSYSGEEEADTLGDFA